MINQQNGHGRAAGQEEWNFQNQTQHNTAQARDLQGHPVVYTMNSHVGDVLEDEGLVDLRVAVLPVDLGLVLGLLVRQQVDLDEGVSGASGPVGRRQVLALDDL